MPTLFDLYGIDLGQPDEPPPPPKSGLIRRVVGDSAVSAVKGAIAIPEAAVGLASIFTGGQAGKLLENEGGAVGFRPKQAREFLDSLYSPEQQAANREVQQAQGFIDTTAAALRNPSTIAQAVVESAPSMLPAAGIARAGMALKANPLLAIGAGEGIVSAGQTAEQIRQQTDDGLLTGQQSLIAGTSGALTGVIGGVAGKIANKLGIGDVQQMLAGVQQAGPRAEKALTRALLEGFATEGILQELPQSAQEQIAQNVALGKPWDEGVGNAAAMGALAGGVMGVGGAAIGRLQRQPEPTAPADPLAEGNARAEAAMQRLATTNDVGQMIEAAREIATATPLQPLAITPEQEARVMQAGEELAQADLTDIKNMGRLDRTRSPEPPAPPAPIIPASEEGPAPFLDRLLTATEALQDPAVRQRVEQAKGPQYLAQLDQYAEVANTPGVMDGVGDQVRERFLSLLERAVFPERFRQPAPQVSMPERRKSDPVPIEPFNVKPVTDPVLDYVEAKRAENTMAARAFVKEFEAGRITRRDVVRVMQDRNADPLGSNPNPLADIQPAEPAPNLIQQRLQAAARAGQAQPSGIQIETNRARPKGASDERNPERAAPGEGRAVDAGSQPGTSGVVQGELQQPGAPGPAGAPVPSAVQGVDAERAGRGLGDDALSGDVQRNAFGLPMGYAPTGAQRKKAAGELKAGDWINDGGRLVQVRGVEQIGDGKVAVDADTGLARMTLQLDGQQVVTVRTAKWQGQGPEPSAKAVASSAQAQAGTPAEGAGGSRPMPGQVTNQAASLPLEQGRQLSPTRNSDAEFDDQKVRPQAGGLSLETGSSNASDKGKARPSKASSVQDVDQRQGQVLKPEESVLSQLRGARNQDLPGVVEQLPGVSGRGRRKTEPEPLAGSDRQQRPLRAGERALADQEGAGAQHAKKPPTDARGKDANADGLGRGDRPSPIDAAVPTSAGGNDRGPGVGDAAQERAAPSGRKLESLRVAGFSVAVEQEAGSERAGIDPDGKRWKKTMAHHYGYLKNTSGADGDSVDVFVNPGTPQDFDGMVFVVDQADPKTGRWDEHKVMMGFPSAKAAQEAYEANYDKGWKGLRAVQPMTMEQFKAWVSDPANTKKPAAKGVKPGKGEKVERPDELVELRKREAALKSLRECLG